MEIDEILKDYGWCQIIKRIEKYFIRYDRGGIAIEMFENEISKEKADKALISQLEAEKVILEIQNNEGKSQFNL